jgi:hypothetical protein
MGRRWTIVSVLGLVACGLGGCGDSRGSTSAASVGLAEVGPMVARYVDALRSGDVKAAMQERCAAARIPAENNDLFANQTNNLLRNAGITSVEVAPASSIVVTPIDTSLEPIQFGYTVKRTGGADARLNGVAVVEDGAVRWCGYAQSNVDETTALLEAPIASSPDRNQSAQEWMPAVGPKGFELADDKAVASVPTDGEKSAWNKVWKDPEYGGVRVTATKYDSVTSSEEAVRTAVTKVANDVTKVFSIDELPNTVGMRYAAAAWTWIQPADAGYQCDQVLMLHTTTVVAINWCGLNATESHQGVIELATQINKANS